MKNPLFLFASLCFCSVVYASNDSQGIDQRQNHHAERIERGVATGQLTEREAERLQRRDDRLERHQDRAMADGEITRREKTRLQRETKRNSHAIKRESHDRQGERRKH